MKVKLDRNFFDRNPVVVAGDLLGKILVREYLGNIISGRIVETEAYLSKEDPAAHSSFGKTKRTNSLFGPPGHAYVHSIHQQNCLDIVVQPENVPGSVLIRALEPLLGIEIMQFFRKRQSLVDLTSGPGKLTQALVIDRSFDGIDLFAENSALKVIADDFFLKPEDIISSPRIGIRKAKEYEFRFFIKGNPFVSKLR